MGTYTSFILERFLLQRVDTEAICEAGLLDHSRFRLREIPIKKKKQGGQLQTVKKQYLGTIPIFDQDALETLRQWESEGARVYAFMEGTHYLFWEKPTHFSLGQELQDEDGLNGFMLEMQTEDGLDSPLVVHGKGYDLSVDGEELGGFIGYNPDEDGITVGALPPNTLTEDIILTWTIDGQDYQMQTVIAE